MENITSVAGLKNAIQLLEVEQEIKLKQLKEQFHLTYESLKPMSLLDGILKDFGSMSNVIDSLLGAVVGYASGYLSKKILVGGSANIFKRLLGSVLQFGVTNVVSKHPEDIKSIGQLILQYIFRKKEHETLRDGELNES